ncbi:hypothetical protein CRM22_005026 [Opisthorchis felineus]|uniref:RRM domain-containing protein n=1 Tax=Opisthorchis felineus TaxID=147828 RepID=A0A4S2M044_OPIFE|nr:hypothetical protein CRM22_005026 [Opisthorchis felineus]
MVHFCVRVSHLHQSTKVKEIKAFFHPLHVTDTQFFKNGKALVYFRQKEDCAKALKKQGCIHGRTILLTPWEAKPNQRGAKNKEKVESAQPAPWPVKSREELEAAIRESGRLFVRNLSFQCTEQDLEKLFSKYGSLSDIHLSYDMRQQVSRGFAFVTFLFPAEAVTAFQKLDKTDFMGRLLHILPGEDPPEKKSPEQACPEGRDNRQNKNHLSEFQTTRLQELKASAGTAHNWNTLFIRPDAVATYLAAKFGLTKEQVLEPSERGSVAVRLAHAEAQLVSEMREFLEKHGVNLDAFDDPESSEKLQSGRRDRLEAKAAGTMRQLSGTAFLIKNLPAGTTAVEVRDLLNRYSKSARPEDSQTLTTSRIRPKSVIVPPLGITAIVEFPLPQQARLMYRYLAYEPYRDSILYLQWLPEGALKDRSDAVLEPTGDEKGRSEKSKRKRKRAHETAMDPTATGNEPRTTQDEFELITSLPSEDTEAETNSHRQQRPRTTSDESMDTDYAYPEEPAKPKARKYQNKKDRLKQQLQASDGAPQSEINEVSPDVEHPSSSREKKTEHKEKRKEDKKSPEPTKPVLLCRNVSFQATQKELTELFSPIGGLIRVRLPQKPSGGHRGFAFLEFATIDQAEMALKTLGKDTHFLGRRLNIEFALG